MNENKENVEEMKSETIAEENINEVKTENQNESEETNESQEEVKELSVEEKLAEALQQVEDLKKEALYKAAEFDNFRKRVIKEKAELIKTGGANVVKAILPIIDDFERADLMMEKAEDVNAVKEGVKLIIEKFMKQLATEGLHAIDCVGKEFDTDYHEAVAMVPGQPEDMKNKVMDCIQTGYMLHDTVIRHSKVAVAQ